MTTNCTIPLSAFAAPAPRQFSIPYSLFSSQDLALSPGSSPCLSAPTGRNMTAWAGASPTSGGPGQVIPPPSSKALHGRHTPRLAAWRLCVTPGRFLNSYRRKHFFLTQRRRDAKSRDDFRRTAIRSFSAFPVRRPVLRRPGEGGSPGEGGHVALKRSEGGRSRRSLGEGGCFPNFCFCFRIPLLTLQLAKNEALAEKRRVPRCFRWNSIGLFLNVLARPLRQSRRDWII
jgi:hypothetical protein